MLHAHSPRRTARAAVVLLGALAGCAFLAAPARAADPNDAQTSLKLIPADAAFYSTMLRNREQYEAVANSRAWAKLWSLPAVQQAWAAFQQNSKTQLDELRRIFDTDDNKDLLALLGDASSDEIFVYGDDTWVGFLDLYQQASAASQSQPVIAQLGGTAGGRSEAELQTRAFLSVLAANPNLIKVPNIVIGFKVTDAKRAERQLKRLEVLAEQAADQTPQLKGRVKRTKIGDSSFLTLTADGSQVPWDAIPWDKVEDKPGEFKPLVRKLKALKLTIAVGVRHDYLMVSIGGSTEPLTQLDGDGPRLDQRPEFKPLAKFADRKLASIGYASQAFNRLAASNALRQMGSLVDLAKAGLAKADLTEAERKALLKDLADLNDGLKESQPTAGAEMSFTFLTDRGYEGYAYDYGKHDDVDGSKPLTLLDHLGGSPLMAVVGRAQTSIEGYERLVKGIKTAYGRLDEIALEKLTGDDKDRYVKAKADFLPLLERLDEATDKLLLPALADGQAGFVLDARWTSKRWAKSLPETPAAMPGPEVGILVGVSDADRLRKAMADYRTIVNEALTKIKAWPGGDKLVGDFQIPPPKSEKKEAGTLYSYPLPEEWGLDPQVAPTAGLTDDAAVLTLSASHAERLLTPKPLKVDGGPLADRKRPLAGAALIDWAGVVNALTPWAELAANDVLDRQGADVPAKAREGVLRQVRTALTVLKCWRGSTAATYLEDGVLVTHHESVFRDLEK